MTYNAKQKGGSGLGFKVRIEIDPECNEEIIIKCKSLNEEALRLQSLISDTASDEIELSLGSDIHFVKISGILFFETDGTKTLIKGSVDRVDAYKFEGNVYVRVVDYKTGQKDFSPCDLEKGKNLQMFLYLSAIEDTKNNALLEDIGVCNGGNWRGGEWQDGVWNGGDWHCGNWRKGVWNNGTWHGGWWYDGSWKGGVWKGGNQLGSTGKWTSATPKAIWK